MVIGLRELLHQLDCHSKQFKVNLKFQTREISHTCAVQGSFIIWLTKSVFKSLNTMKNPLMSRNARSNNNKGRFDEILSK